MKTGARMMEVVLLCVCVSPSPGDIEQNLEVKENQLLNKIVCPFKATEISATCCLQIVGLYSFSCNVFYSQMLQSYTLVKKVSLLTDKHQFFIFLNLPITLWGSGGKRVEGNSGNKFHSLKHTSLVFPLGELTALLEVAVANPRPLMGLGYTEIQSRAGLVGMAAGEVPSLAQLWPELAAGHCHTQAPGHTCQSKPCHNRKVCLTCRGCLLLLLPKILLCRNQALCVSAPWLSTLAMLSWDCRKNIFSMLSSVLTYP